MREARLDNALAALDILARADSTAFNAARSDAVTSRAQAVAELAAAKKAVDNASSEAEYNAAKARVAAASKAYHAATNGRSDAAERQVTEAEARTLNAARTGAAWFTGEGSSKKWWTHAKSPARNDAIHTNAPKDVAPKGKRSIRENTWGNTNAYIGGRFWKTIGPTYAVGTEERAAAFLRGEDD